MQTCRAKTKSGKKCCARACADGLCSLHGNPDAARELGAKGGRGNRRRVLEPIELPDQMSVGELKPKTLAVMRMILKHEISSSDAIAFLQLSRQYERLSDLEPERIEILQQRVAELSRANAELAKANAELSKAKSSSEGQQLDGEKDHAAGENSSQMTRDAAEPEFSRTRPKQRK